jgi:hypothetical protein
MPGARRCRLHQERDVLQVGPETESMPGQGPAALGMAIPPVSEFGDVAFGTR